jgi:hypothetical protein
LAEASRTKNAFVNATTGATVSNGPIDGHGWNRTDTEFLGVLGDLVILHVENYHVARITRPFPDLGHGIITYGTTGAENFHFSVFAHFNSP